MSQADELLNSLSGEATNATSPLSSRSSYIFIDASTGKQYRLYVNDGQLMMSMVADGESGGSSVRIENHIIVDHDRFVSVPDELRRIAVQYDHNIETVVFDCPRYWDGIDLSPMRVYINYKRSDGVVGSYLCENVTIDDTDDEIIHFDWVISRHVTSSSGALTFNVCIKDVDDSGNETEHWNSELNEEMYISEGLEPTTVVVNKFPDVITWLLDRMDHLEECEVAVTGDQILNLQTQITDHVNAVNEYETSNDKNIAALQESDKNIKDRVTSLENRTITNIPNNLTVTGNLTASGTLTAKKVVGAVYA